MRPLHVPSPLRLCAPILTGLFLSGCGAEGSESDSARELRHVLLISLDTLRADACSLYGYDKETTPVLDRFAAERGVVFENHMVNSNNTLTSHATMLTGLLMMVHGTEDRGRQRTALAPEFETVAERFQTAGYETAAFTAHPVWLSPEFGFDQGFDHFETEWTNAQDLTERFVSWIDGDKPRKIFAFLHFYDAHSEGSGKLPYAAPRSFRQRFAPERPDDFEPVEEGARGQPVQASKLLDLYNAPGKDFPPPHVEWLRGCYDAGVAKLDQDLGELFAALDERGILDEALIVITSDHGEEFEDHGGTLHSSFYDEIMHVPLVIAPPSGAELPRKRVDDASRCVDLAVTMLDLAGLEPLKTTQGRSLAPVLAGETLDFVGTFFGKGVLRDRDEHSLFKVVSVKESPLFFDLDADPGEHVNLMDSPEFKRENGPRLLEASKGVRDARRECDLLRAKIDAKSGSGPALNPKQMADLRALGYLGDEGPDEE